MDDRARVERWRRVEALYHDAAAMPVSERVHFLRRACGDDVSMREEIEALLAAAGEGALPVQIGRYELVSPLGAGGMGAVFKARDTQLNRLVAIKFLSTNLIDESARRRFQQEAQMASALNHPHILTVHEAGEIEGGQYLVTEFVDGGTLEDWSRAEARSWRQIVDLLIGVGDGRRRRMRPGSCTAISSLAMSWCRRAAMRSWPTSAWPSSRNTGTCTP